jgi:hypothetical protein
MGVAHCSTDGGPGLPKKSTAETAIVYVSPSVSPLTIKRASDSPVTEDDSAA